MLPNAYPRSEIQNGPVTIAANYFGGLPFPSSPDFDPALFADRLELVSESFALNLADRDEADEAMGVLGTLATLGQDPEATPVDDLVRAPILAVQLSRLAIRWTEASDAPRLTRLAERDPLTGMFNRRALLSRLQAAIERAESGENHGMALLFTDLDGFKGVNDTFGHPVGDKLLKGVAGVLGRLLRVAEPGRPGDVVIRMEEGEPEGLAPQDAAAGEEGVAGTAARTAARLGGDEFVVIIEHGPDNVPAAVEGEPSQGSLIVARRLDHGVTRYLTQYVDRLGYRGRVGTSTGIVEWAPGMDAPTILRLADAAMYAAKPTRPKRSNP